VKFIGSDDGLYGIKDPFEANTSGKYGKHWSEAFEIEVLKLFI
jgi:hypothetical protein